MLVLNYAIITTTTTSKGLTKINCLVYFVPAGNFWYSLLFRYEIVAL